VRQFVEGGFKRLLIHRAESGADRLYRDRVDVTSNRGKAELVGFA